jgi:hypothetical protein
MWEVRVPQDGGRFAYHRTKLGHNPLEMHVDPPAGCGFQSAEQLIEVDRITLGFYHF